MYFYVAKEDIKKASHALSICANLIKHFKSVGSDKFKNELYMAAARLCGEPIVELDNC